MSEKPGRAHMAMYAALGAVAPDVMLLYSKRFTMPDLTFSIGQYVLASLCYVGLAAALAMVFPYKGRPSPYKAFALGVGLPLVIAGLASLANSPAVVPRGVPVPGELLDLIAFK